MQLTFEHQSLRVQPLRSQKSLCSFSFSKMQLLTVWPEASFITHTINEHIFEYVFSTVNTHQPQEITYYREMQFPGKTWSVEVINITDTHKPWAHHNNKRRWLQNYGSPACSRGNSRQLRFYIASSHFPQLLSPCTTCVCVHPSKWQLHKIINVYYMLVNRLAWCFSQLSWYS